jgi:hypothetical protein
MDNVQNCGNYINKSLSQTLFMLLPKNSEQESKIKV